MEARGVIKTLRYIAYIKIGTALGTVSIKNPHLSRDLSLKNRT